MPLRTIHALQFCLTRGDRECAIIIWPFANQPTVAAPTYPQSWLDLGMGDAVTLKGERWRVCRVTLYRVEPAETNGNVVRTGRTWLRDSGPPI